MKICLVTNTLSGGGSEKQLLLIARGLAGRGFPCSIYVLNVTRETGRYVMLLDSCRKEGVQIQASDHPLGVIGVISRLITTVVKERHQVILWTWGYRAETLRLTIPLLWLGRGIFSIRSASESQLQRWRRLLRYGRPLTWRYVSNSQLGIELADKVAPGIRGKARVVLNAMEPSSFESSKPSSSRPDVMQVVMLGNVRYLVKGYDVALAVAHLIKTAGLPIQIHVGGAQPQGEPLLAERIVQEGLAGIMSWDGPVAMPEDYLRTGHVFMLLSRYEGMPNALFEAMALGLPCIATEVGDLGRFQKQADIMKLVPIADAAAAFSMLKEVWENWEVAMQLGRRGRDYCRANFSEARMIESVCDALDLPLSTQK
ncbi:MAG: glycosyltransferase family 4 protein [Opitutaceae bacterium]|nr:glycosyltransferase family 4 protein [Opitutaceae bacterium]